MSDQKGNGQLRVEYLNFGFSLLNVFWVALLHALVVFSGILLLKQTSMHLLFLGIVCYVLIVLIHQHMISEWLHEASHYCFVSNKKLNDLLTNLLISVFFGTPVSVYRKAHLNHHQSKTFFSEYDPDTSYATIISRKDLFNQLLKDITGVNALKAYFRMLFASRQNVQKTEQVSRIGLIVFYFWCAAFHLTLVYTLWITGYLITYLLYYLVMLTLYPLMSRLRLYGQHAEILGEGVISLSNTTNSRTINCSIFEKLFLSSKLMMYHFEHHRYPNLPFRALEKISIKCDDINKYSESHFPILKLLISKGRFQ